MKKNRVKVFILVAIAIILIIAAFIFLLNKAEPVEVLSIEEKPYAEKIIAVGQLGPKQQTTLIAEVSGTVRSIFAEEGATIYTGDSVLEIENEVTSDYDSAKSEYSRISSLVATAATDYDNAKTLFEEGAISQKDLTSKKSALESAVSQQKAAQYQLEIAGFLDKDKYLVRAPWDAILLKAYVAPGDYIKSGQSLADLGSLSGYKITAEVDEKYYPVIKKGLPVLISVGDAQTDTARGEISSITPKINEETGTFEIGIQIPDSFPYLASNLTVNLEILLLEKDSAIVIPEKYLLSQAEGAPKDQGYVFLYQEGKVKEQSVQMVLGNGANILISQGLKQGDLLILPEQDLEEGDPVRPIMEGTVN